MPPSQDDSLGAQIGVRVPAHLNTAAEQIANLRNYQVGPHESFYKSDTVREALEVYIFVLGKAGKLPEETRELLDGDLKADAGEGGLPSPDALEELNVQVSTGVESEGNPRRAVEA